MAWAGHYGWPQLHADGYADTDQGFAPDNGSHHAYHYPDPSPSSYAHRGPMDDYGAEYPTPPYDAASYRNSEDDFASSYGSSFSCEALDVDIPAHILEQVRSIVDTTMQTQQRRLRSLDAPQDVVRAAYQRVLQETRMTRRYPDGAVMYNWTDAGQPISAWALGAPLAFDHPWNLLALSQAAKDIHRLRGISLRNLGGLTTASSGLSPFWGHNVDRTWLPNIIPHSNPPAPSTQPGLTKHHARELEALQWVFDADYGYAHLCVLRRDDPDLYALVQELAKAVALRNIVRSCMGCCDLAEAWRRVQDEKRAARRVRFQDVEG